MYNENFVLDGRRLSIPQKIFKDLQNSIIQYVSKLFLVQFIRNSNNQRILAQFIRNGIIQHISKFIVRFFKISFVGNKIKMQSHSTTIFKSIFI